jgi:hypothetical protein
MRVYQPERTSYVDFAFFDRWSGMRDGFTHEIFDKGIDSNGKVMFDGKSPIVYVFPRHLAENMQGQGVGSIVTAHYVVEKITKIEIDTVNKTAAKAEAVIEVDAKVIAATEQPGVTDNIAVDTKDKTEPKAPEIAAPLVKPTKSKGSAK